MDKNALLKKIIGVFRGPEVKKAGSGDHRKPLGARGEKAAAALYGRQGFVILDRNYRCPLGEIDLVARKENLLVICEVKTRRTATYGRPEMAVTARKRKRLVALAKYYLKHRGLQELKVRFDVVAVYWPEGARKPEVRQITEAFTG